MPSTTATSSGPWCASPAPSAYRYRDDLFPSVTFRRAYDRLHDTRPGHADRDYVRLLYLAASTAESEVETALTLLLEAGRAPTFDAARDLVRLPQAQALPALGTPVLDLAAYDRLLPSRCAHVPA